MPVSLCKWITETFTQKLSIVIYLLESLTFQALVTLFTFGFTGLVQKQFRIYLSHTQASCLFKYCCTTVTYHFLFTRCSPLQFLLPLPTTSYDLWNKAEIFVSCWYKPWQFYSHYAMCKIILHNGHSVCHLPSSAVQLFLMSQKSMRCAFHSFSLSTEFCFLFFFCRYQGVRSKVRAVVSCTVKFVHLYNHTNDFHQLVCVSLA